MAEVNLYVRAVPQLMLRANVRQPILEAMADNDEHARYLIGEFEASQRKARAEAAERNLNKGRA